MPQTDSTRPSLVDALAPANVEVLLLRGAGLSDDDIAAWLHVPTKSVAVIADIAARKLKRLFLETSPQLER